MRQYTHRTISYPDPGEPFNVPMVEALYTSGRAPLLATNETMKRLNLFVKFGPTMRELKAALGEQDGATVLATAYQFKDRMPLEYRNPRWGSIKRGTKQSRAVDEALTKQRQRHDRKVEKLQAKLEAKPTTNVEVVIEEIIHKVAEFDKLESTNALLLQERDELRVDVDRLELEVRTLTTWKEQLKDLLA